MPRRRRFNVGTNPLPLHPYRAAVVRSELNEGPPVEMPALSREEYAQRAREHRQATRWIEDAVEIVVPSQKMRRRHNQTARLSSVLSSALETHGIAALVTILADVTAMQAQAALKLRDSRTALGLVRASEILDTTAKLLQGGTDA